MEMHNSSSTEARFIILGPQPQKSSCCDNSIFTAKYNLINFIPKALLLQFLRLSNIVFLANAVLQSIPMISSLSPLTAVAPLSFVLLVSLFRQAYQDCKRHSKDNEINLRKTRILREGRFQEVQWRDVKVGDFIKVKNKQIIPCDILLLFSSQENSMCYVQTANLDGQNNLKQKFAFTQEIKTFPEEFERLVGVCKYGLPKASLHQFDGTITIGRGDEQYIGVQNLLLRQTTLKNTDQIVGLALYCGHDTKIFRNQGIVHHKVSQIQKKLNYIQIGLLFILGAISGSCSLGFFIIHGKNNLRNVTSYIPLQGLSLPAQSGINIFTIFLLLNFLIPISLVIFMEAVKTFSGVFLSMDKKLEDKKTESTCGVLNCSLIEELGVIDFILTDKTGTLTANQMVFKKIAIENLVLTREELIENVKDLHLSSKLNEFLLCMSICHQVVNDNIKEEYQGSSPDQVCFVNFTKTINYEFIKRTQVSIQLNLDNKKVVYKLVDILKFDSRKRMSVVVQLPEKQDQVIIYTKGADTQVFDKCKDYPLFKKLYKNLNEFATEGLRTLVFAKRKMKMQQYQQFIDRRSKLKFNFVQRNLTKEEYNARLNRIVEEIESELEILGASGIQDKLQEEVPQTIQRLQRAGITVIMITGDKLETAQNIGYLARFIKNEYRVVRLASNDITTQETIKTLMGQIQAEDISVIIQGNQISRMLKEENERIIKLYSNMFRKAKSIIFCRTSPKEKAEIAKFIKHNLKVVVLAIGDGGNDVGMIEEAQIGVGIIGKEGNSAAAVSDFSFAQFKFLDRLLLHHGRWFYYRLSYFFIFCGWKNTIITFLMYFANVFNSFSGIINFTQSFYALYNSFFAVVQTIYFGLYQQDINDDLQIQIKDFLPQIYKQTKERDLFSTKRYVLWSISGIVGAIFIYFITMQSLNPLTAINQYGRPADVITERLSNGIALSLIVILINYIDTQSHTFFFEVIIFWFGSLGLTALFFVFQNYFSFMDYYQCYRENMNPRFWLVILLAVIACVMVKMTIQTYYFQIFPSMIDMYKKYKHGNYQSFKMYLKQTRRMVLLGSKENKDNCQTDEELQFYSSELSKSLKDSNGRSRMDKMRLNYSQEVGTNQKLNFSGSKPNETTPQNNLSYKQVNIVQSFSLTKWQL